MVRTNGFDFNSTQGKWWEHEKINIVRWWETSVLGMNWFFSHGNFEAVLVSGYTSKHGKAVWLKSQALFSFKDTIMYWDVTLSAAIRIIETARKKTGFPLLSRRARSLTPSHNFLLICIENIWQILMIYSFPELWPICHLVT